jgi:hypothetical protein
MNDLTTREPANDPQDLERLLVARENAGRCYWHDGVVRARRRGPTGVGKVDDGQVGHLFAKVVDQLNALRPLDLGVADDQVAVLQANGKLGSGERVVGMEYSVTVIPQGVDDKLDHAGVLIGHDDNAGQRTWPDSIGSL